MQNKYKNNAKCVQGRCKIHTKAMQNTYKGDAKCGVTDDLNSLNKPCPTHFGAPCAQSSQLWSSAPYQVVLASQFILAFKVWP